MFKTRGRLIALAAGAVALLVAATLAYLSLPPRQTRDVAVPPPNATPEQVVTAYLDAMNAHDCATAEAVMSDTARDIAKTWCDDVASLTDVAMRGPSLNAPSCPDTRLQRRSPTSR